MGGLRYDAFFPGGRPGARGPFARCLGPFLPGVKRGELRALELGAIDPGDLQTAIADLVKMWPELFPRERARVLALLIEELRFDAPRGEVEIIFRPNGL